MAAKAVINSTILFISIGLLIHINECPSVVSEIDVAGNPIAVIGVCLGFYWDGKHTIGCYTEEVISIVASKTRCDKREGDDMT